MSVGNEFTRSGSSFATSEAESDPSRIAQHIEDTRGDMSDTLDALQQRLEPEQLADQAKEFAHFVILELKEAVRDLASQATSTLREAKANNASSGNPSAAASGNGTKHRGSAELALPMSRRVGTQMQAKAGQAHVQAKGIWQTLEANPLAIGAIGIALGGIAAAMAAMSEKENALMGDARDQVVSSLHEVAEGAVESVKGAAKAGAATVQKG